MADFRQRLRAEARRQTSVEDESVPVRNVRRRAADLSIGLGVLGVVVLLAGASTARLWPGAVACVVGALAGIGVYTSDVRRSRRFGRIAMASSAVGVAALLVARLFA